MGIMDIYTEFFIFLLYTNVIIAEARTIQNGSCRERCLEEFDERDERCRCDQPCVQAGACCSDFMDVCAKQLNPLTSVRRPVVDVTDQELRTLGNQLWGRDVNRGTRSEVVISITGNRLFDYVNPSLLGRLTYTRFRNLLDNYEHEIGVPEPSCPVCDAEVTAFLDDIMNTEVMLHAWAFLADHGLASSSTEGFKNELRQYWFQPYSRSQGAALDSSGFEHVFVGELRGSEVTGFHNWVMFYQEELLGLVRYRDYQNSCMMDIIRLGFDWFASYKPVSSFFFGVSPEFEMALFTVCFQARQSGYCDVDLNGYSAQIRTFSMANVSPRTVGSAYPNC